MIVKKHAMSEEFPIKTGHYQHYKGGDYDVISVAKHSETLEPLVVYRCRRDNDSWWVRPLSMFTETVVIAGVEKPRFRYMGS